MISFTHLHGLPPVRLDRLLARTLGLGLRRCRALIEEGLVLVDGRHLPKGGMVCPGQMVSVDDRTEAPSMTMPPGVVVVARDGAFAALTKPAGVHAVAGRGRSCVETCLPALGLEGWILLNRLDLLTSGLVLAAATADDAAAYMGWQDGGRIHKWYLAVARGTVGVLTLKGRILDDRRRVVRVAEDEDETLRWTRVCPVRRVNGGSLVLVGIHKGRRHQIRAHLARAGHPLVGDPVYGAGEPGGLFLHGWRVDMSGFSAASLPDWPDLDAAAIEAARQALLPW